MRIKKFKVVGEEEIPIDEEKIAWENVQIYYQRVKTLDEINDKALNRAGKDMKRCIFDLLNAIRAYDEIKGKQ